MATNDVNLSDGEHFQSWIGHYPAGGSLKSIFQFLQNIRDDQASTGFNYGSDAENMERYS